MSFARRPDPTRNFKVCAEKDGSILVRWDAVLWRSGNGAEVCPQLRRSPCNSKTPWPCCVGPSAGTKLDLRPELRTWWPFSFVIKQKQEKKKALYHLRFFVQPLCILALPCIINEFYIFIDKVKSKEILNYTHAPFREMEMWAFVCVRVSEARRGSCLNILNWTMWNWWAWKRTGKIVRPCQYFLKQAECEYFVLQPLSGTSLFQCKCEPIIFISQHSPVYIWF